MQRELTILFSLILGTAFVAGPSLMTIGSDSAYDTALAAKGGNGNGKGGGNGNGKAGLSGGSTAAKGGKSSTMSASLAGAKTKGAKSKLDKTLNSRMGAL